MKIFSVIIIKTVPLITFLILLVMGCGALQSHFSRTKELPDSDSGKRITSWDLVWSDEFDYQGLPDPSKWGYEVGYVRNNELQYYTQSRRENARVKDGLLVIETRKESSYKMLYTSASLTTYGKVSWIYGRIEVKAKLPSGKGMWPAIFMLGRNIENVGWPACGEIDIMENVGFDPNMIYVNIHTQAYNWVLETNKGTGISIPLPFKSFHVYAIEWFEDRIIFFIDGKQYFSFENQGTGSETWPFNKKFYLIINAAFGGNWGGKIGVDDSILPQRFYIDYVRVYKSDQGKD